MPTVKRFHRCRIEMYFDDHDPPHFHIVTTNEQRVAVAIKTLAIIAGAANKRDVIEALEWASANEHQLAARWAEYSESE